MATDECTLVHQSGIGGPCGKSCLCVGLSKEEIESIFLLRFTAVMNIAVNTHFILFLWLMMSVYRWGYCFGG